MKIMLSILIGIFFLLIGILDFNGYLNIKEIYLFGVESMGKTDISWFLGFLENYLIIPKYIDKQFSEIIFNFINKYFIINYNQIFYIIIFSIYLTFSLITLNLLSFFLEKRDKIIIFFSLFILYTIGLHFMNLLY